jgi:hypothetical protein
LVASLTNFAWRQFLERIVTADEISVYHYEPENKAQSMNWKCTTSPVAKKFKSQPSAGKIMLTLFLGDIEGTILVHFTPNGSDQRFPYVWPDERSSKKIFIRLRSHCRDAKLVKDTTKKLFFLTELKNLMKRRNRCVEVEGTGLKSDISFLSIYLEQMCFFKSPFTF